MNNQTKKKSPTKKPLVNKADLDKINDAVDHVVTMNAMYQNVFYNEKIPTLAKQISDMVTDEVNTGSETTRRVHGRKITKTLNEMFELFVEHEDDTAAMLSKTDERSAVINLLKFADKVGMLRLLHVPKFNRKSSVNAISFKVYIARMQVCWCRIRISSGKSGNTILTRFTN